MAIQGCLPSYRVTGLRNLLLMLDRVKKLMCQLHDDSWPDSIPRENPLAHPTTTHILFHLRKCMIALSDRIEALESEQYQTIKKLRHTGNPRCPHCFTTQHLSKNEEQSDAETELWHCGMCGMNWLRAVESA